MQEKDYSDIINVKYPYPTDHQPMPRSKRAAQFAPFAALTGHDEAISEAQRQTSPRVNLTNEEKEIISHKLNEIINRISDRPTVKLIYFKEDAKKSGGQYITYEGRLKKYDEFQRRLTFEDSITINVDEIVSIFSD